MDERQDLSETPPGATPAALVGIVAAPLIETALVRLMAFVRGAAA